MLFPRHPLPPGLHVLIITHTARHISACAAALAAQTRSPASITISCDGDTPELEAAIRGASDRHALVTRAILRPHAGASRSAQARNNAVRALLATPRPPQPDDLLVMVDGDIALAPDALATYAAIAARRRADLLIGFRIDLTPAQTDAFTAAPTEPEPGQLDALLRRDRRYHRQSLARRLGLGKPHKPKLLSANFAVRLAAFQSVNGFDEAYEGYGQEDDDLARRLYRASAREAVAVRYALAFHLYHPTRAPGDWHDSPNAARFRDGYHRVRAGQVRCELGLDTPRPQPAPRLIEFAPLHPAHPAPAPRPSMTVEHPRPRELEASPSRA